MSCQVIHTQNDADFLIVDSNVLDVAVILQMQTQDHH